MFFTKHFTALLALLQISLTTLIHFLTKAILAIGLGFALLVNTLVFSLLCVLVWAPQEVYLYLYLYLGGSGDDEGGKGGSVTTGGRVIDGGGSSGIEGGNNLAGGGDEGLRMRKTKRVRRKDEDEISDLDLNDDDGATLKGKGEYGSSGVTTEGVIDGGASSGIEGNDLRMVVWG